ncbi:MAG: PA14 domain-containing protein [Verrucomicrobia bacterium]|nr:PA14 domain-containing protein [Verrucomicrobiota bacterium]
MKKRSLDMGRFWIFIFIFQMGLDLLGGVAIEYEVPVDGGVSLGVYDKENRLVRTLLTGKPHSTGSYTLEWDGRDRYGNPLPTGKYQWKLLATRGLRSEFITQIGQNVNPLWEKATGNHEPPRAASIDASGIYRFGSVNEGTHSGVKTDWDGRHIWTSDRRLKDPWVHGSLTTALVGNKLFELIPDGTVYGYDSSNGEIFTGSDAEPEPWNFRWKGFQAPGASSDEERRALHIKFSPSDLVGHASSHLLVAGYPQFNAICWFNAKNGELVDTIENIPAMLGLAMGENETVFVVSDNAIISLDRKTRSPRVIISRDQLDAPVSVCVHQDSGDILVAENNELRGYMSSTTRHCQVKRFTKTGELIQMYGRPDGRQDGVYFPEDFRGITNIEATAGGGFVITEGKHTPPRRTAWFDHKGECIKEWSGAQHYGIIACPEPNNPSYVWFRANADPPALVRCHIDYETKAWKVVEIYQDVFAQNQYAHVPLVPYVMESMGVVYIHGGGVQTAGMTLCRYDPTTQKLRPCNASETQSTEAGRMSYLWNDLNDDGLATDNEVEWLERNKLGGALVKEDFTLLTTPSATAYQPGHILKPTSMTSGGTPIYDWDQAQPLIPWKENGATYFPNDYLKSPDGSWYACYSSSVSNPHEGHENHGAWYYNSCSAIDRLVKWNKDWQPIWSVGKHSPDNDHEIGSTSMPRGLVGHTRQFIIWADASDEELVRPTVWTDDGLYVDELLRVPIDTIPKLKHGVDNSNEYPLGHLYDDPLSGAVYFYALSSAGGSPIYKITGWDNCFHDHGTIDLTDQASPGITRNGSGLLAEYFNNSHCSGTPAVIRRDKLVYFHWLDGLDVLPEGIHKEDFSCRWSGQIETPTSENYRFIFESMTPWRGNGWGTPGRPRWVKLWIGGNLVLDTLSGLQTPTTYAFPGSYQGIYGEIPLVAGQRYDLRLECSFSGNAVAKLCWETPALDRLAIRTEYLHPDPGPTHPITKISPGSTDVLASIHFDSPEGNLDWSAHRPGVFGRMTGNCRRVPGVSGSGLEMESHGPLDPAVYPIDEALALPDGDYSISFWFKSTSAEARLCEARRYTSYNNQWSDHVVSIVNGQVYFLLSGDSPLVSSKTYNDGHWHHLSTSVGPNGQKLYIDAQLVGTGNLSKRTRSSNRLGLDSRSGNDSIHRGY